MRLLSLLVLLSGCTAIVGDREQSRHGATPDGGGTDAVADPVSCANVGCDPPPKSECLDATTLRSYATGTCAQGACSYPHEDTVCPDGCRSGACASVPKSRIGIFRDGTWTIDSNGNGVYDPGVDRTFTFGLPGDQPVVGDWNGDGRLKVGVFRGGSNDVGLWALDWNGDDTWDPKVDRSYSFGTGHDLPVVGDWEGSGRTCLGTFRGVQPNNGVFSLDASCDGVWNASADPAIYFGLAADLPIAGDWTGAGRSNIGVFRLPTTPDTALWQLDWDGDHGWNPSVDKSLSFGGATDLPVVGDWNGDGRAKLGVYRAGRWLLDDQGTGSFTTALDFGGPGDHPVVFWR